MVATIRTIASFVSLTTSVVSGRASVPETSLIASPMRRAPTSMPSTRTLPISSDGWTSRPIAQPIEFLAAFARLFQHGLRRKHVFARAEPAESLASNGWAFAFQRGPVRPMIRCYNLFLSNVVVKRILIFLTILLVGTGAACGTGRPPETFRQKLVILGFDGMDPRLVRKWMNERKLPNLKKLAERGGGMQPLETTHSPESPTAWASFATGVNAGKHNIYDFLVRDTNTYLPDLGMVTREPPRFILNFLPISRPKITSIRGGTSFWVTAGRRGVRSSVLTVPVTYPPEEVPNGEILSGLPLPDIRGTMGTFSYYGTDVSRYEEGDTEMGGLIRRLLPEGDAGDVSHTDFIGPPNPIVRQQLRSVRAKTPPTEADKMTIAELEARQDVR